MRSTLALRLQVLGVLLLCGVTVACFRGADRDKQAPVGLPGGLCLGPMPHCDAGLCNEKRNYCYNPSDPCEGFFCGGEERGICSPDAEGQPSCTCELPYTNEKFDLYCCPSEAAGVFDPLCSEAPMPGGSDDSSQ